MGTVKVYNYKRPYDPRIDELGFSRRMATREYIELVGGTIIQETELEVDRSKVDSEGKTHLDFTGR